MRTNPFYELYLADSTSATDFVNLFSPVLIPHVQHLFLPGNIVVVGMQGSGKSMLLTLLKHETRLKYDQVGHEFPVPKDLRKFVSCSVNLTHSNTTDFGNRRWMGMEPTEVEFLFGDFVNVLLVVDLLKTVLAYGAASQRIRSEVGVQVTDDALARFSRSAQALDSWKGWLGDIRDYAGLVARLEERVTEYRAFLHHRRRNISEEILSTRTAMGDPIAEYADLLKSCGLVSQDTNVFVDIDQYEELANIRASDGLAQRIDYRSVINRALSRRDPRISYRVGSRRHSWRSHSRVMGSVGKLENERDYKFVDLDILLKRAENSRTYIFPSFAEDVFQRRMQVAGFVKTRSEISMESVYGASLTATAKAKYYTPENPEKAIFVDKAWRPATQQRLRELARKDPLSARFGEAWIRQKGDITDLDIRDGELPWNTRKQQYWRKDRTELALLQIASSNQQRPIYSGRDEITELSNGNILVFISVNQQIWDQFFRYEANASRVPKSTPKIGIDLQSMGIFKASEHWAQKLEEETGRSAERLSFVKEVARAMREKVMSDRSMSYPGSTGFSIREDELYQVRSVRDFLGELSDYGNMVEGPHTTKDRDRAARIKWYVSPVLCPTLRLPYTRIKEPYYAKLTDLMGWLARAGVQIDGVTATAKAEAVTSDLFARQ
jgi:hypothetical protein